MRARPGRIIDDAPVPFARPRSIEVTFAPDFVAMTQRLRELIVSSRSAEGGRVMSPHATAASSRPPH